MRGEWINEKRFKQMVIGILVVILVAICTWLVIVMPKKDRISVEQLPEEYFIVNEKNYVAFQSGSDCSGYATAYVLRDLGIDIEGDVLYEKIPRFFGRVALGGIRSILKDYGYDSGSYYGTIDTLKAQITKGTPIVALVTITLGKHQGLHYVAVVGYDTEYIYLADSTSVKTNTYTSKQYNRKVTYEEFDELWQTDIYPMNNLYIAIK